MATAVGIVSFVTRLGLWAVVALTALGTLGIEVTPFIASLGIGGVAVALALQNVLGDLLASLSIVLDKPFVVGDFIQVGDLSGSVEYVGLKTTRVRSLSGEQLVFSNSDLLGSRIRNYGRMSERRVAFSLGVTYDTPAPVLRRIPGLVQEAVQSRENARFDRSHLKGFGASSVDFETVYYMEVPDYATYMDTQQAINLEIFERFGAEGIEFAFPTRTIHVIESGAAAD
jgi:small-conductance mechanosensitive channel